MNQIRNPNVEAPGAPADEYRNRDGRRHSVSIFGLRISFEDSSFAIRISPRGPSCSAPSCLFTTALSELTPFIGFGGRARPDRMGWQRYAAGDAKACPPAPKAVPQRFRRVEGDRM